MFNRKKPFQAQRNSTHRVQSASGHWHNGKWYPAASGQAGPQQPRRAPQRANNRGRNNAGRNRSSYDAGNYSDGESGMARRIGFRF